MVAHQLLGLLLAAAQLLVVSFPSMLLDFVALRTSFLPMCTSCRENWRWGCTHNPHQLPTFQWCRGHIEGVAVWSFAGIFNAACPALGEVLNLESVTVNC